MSYNEIALQNAQDQELSSVLVSAMGYSLIAELAGVELGPNGESPADFYYTQIRTFVVAALKEEEEAAADAEEEALITASIKLIPDTDAGKKLKKMKVYRDDEGNILIK